MSGEEQLRIALDDAQIPAYHLVLDGRPECAATYRKSGEIGTYESDQLIALREIFEVRIYQRAYEREAVTAVRAAVELAGFAVTETAQAMEEDYYRDELRLSKYKEMTEDE